MNQHHRCTCRADRNAALIHRNLQGWGDDTQNRSWFKMWYQKPCFVYICLFSRFYGNLNLAQWQFYMFWELVIYIKDIHHLRLTPHTMDEHNMPPCTQEALLSVWFTKVQTKAAKSWFLVNCWMHFPTVGGCSWLLRSPHHLIQTRSHWKSNFPSLTLYSKTGRDEGDGEITQAHYSPLFITQVCGPPNQSTKNSPVAGITTTLTQTWYLCHQGYPRQKVNLWSLAMAH